MSKEQDARNALLAQGCVLIPLRERSKRPLHEAWQDKQYTPDDVEGFVNVGLNHALSNTIAIDVDDVVAATPLFKRLGFKVKDFPGRFTARDNRWKCVFKKPEGMELCTRRDLVLVDNEGVMTHPLEIRGNGQDVLPGSQHPEGGEYLFKNGGMPNELPILPQALVDLYLGWNEVLPDLIQEVYGHPWKAGKSRSGDELTGNRAVIVEAFNAQHSLVEVLERNGYVGTGARYLSPASESGMPGVVLYDDGTCFSNHQSACKLADGNSHDAFDVMRLLEHGGDWDAALASVGVSVDALAATDFVDFEVESEPAKVMGFTRISDLVMREPQWLVPGILEERAVSIWFGDPASYKTFLVVDMAMHIASGRNYHGMGDVKQGSVVYLAGEGHSGFARRVNAWCEYHGVDVTTLDFYKSDRAGTFEKGETRKAMLAGIRASFADAVARRASLFVVDTLARNLGGDENSSEDINAMFDLLNRLQEFYPCITILIVAHPGHQNTNRPRGSAALLGNTDAYAKVEAIRERVAQVTSFKMKDAEDFPRMFFQMDLVPLGVGEDGQQYGSLVPRQIDAALANDGVNEGPEEDPVAVEMKRRWVTLDCFRTGHATRRTVQDALTERGLAQHNNNKYAEYLTELVTDEVLEEHPVEGKYRATEYGVRWLTTRADIIWS